MARHFMEIFAQKTNQKVTGMSKDFLDRLMHHEWKGNVRELKNIIERAVILASGSELDIEHLPIDLQVTAPGQHGGLSAFDLASVEKLHIQRVLNHTKGNKTEAAKLLNIGLTTLYRKIDEYGLGFRD